MHTYLLYNNLGKLTTLFYSPTKLNGVALTTNIEKASIIYANYQSHI